MTASSANAMDLTVEFVGDGEARARPDDLFPGTTMREWRTYPDLLDDTGRLVCAIGAFLIRTREHITLVDLGLGPACTDTADGRSYRGGWLLGNLATRGITPEAVDLVVFTHLHRDHVGWTSTETSSGRVLTFANARHLVHPDEWAHWVSRPGPPGPDPDTVLDPLRDTIEFCTDGDEIGPGLQVLATPGHTPGHISVAIRHPRGHRTVIAGDVVHTPAQLIHPTWGFGTDNDPVQAATTRARLLDAFGADVLACGHFPTWMRSVRSGRSW